MTAINYLCIDDQQGASIEGLLNSLSRRGAVRFERRTPQGLDEQINTIEKFIADAAGGPIGLLIDLRLDVDADAEGNRVTYRGPTLAQELRTRMTERAIPSFPIVLWSVNNKFAQSYSADESSHDLFDEVFGKDEEVTTEPDTVTCKLESLALGYAELSGISMADALKRIGLDDAENSSVYARFASELLSLVDTKATHEVAQFLLKSLIGSAGLLVTEEMLAARLGVDTNASAEAWNSFKNILEPARYRGPFSQAWPRWWWFHIEDWWASQIGPRPGLRRLTAPERVSQINQLLGIKLNDAGPIQTDYSTKYSTLCVALGRPLDPVDGLRVMQGSARSWEDARWVSIYAALERKNKDKWRIDPLERDRFDRLKDETSGTDE